MREKQIYQLAHRDPGWLEYDELREVIVCAYDPQHARKLAHEEAHRSDWRPVPETSEWLKAKETSIRWLGTARQNIRVGVLLAESREG